MVCTYCQSETRVINSRLQKRTNSVWRRRTCNVCRRTFTTNEQVDYEKSWVVQYSDSQRPTPRPFIRDELLISIHRSLGHKNEDALPEALALTKTVIGNLGKLVDQAGVLNVLVISTVTHEILKRFDPVAATVYRAYHPDK